MRISLAVAATLAFAAAPALAADTASAHGLRCGDTITKDTKLDRDLRNCPTNGIVIGADGITLDLNGHVVDGDGELIDPCPPDVACDIGVDNSAGHRGVTIKNGSVREFAVGVLVLDAADNRLLGAATSHNTFSGVVIVGASGTLIDRNSASANGLDTDQAGISILNSQRTEILRSSFARNGDIGLYLETFDDARIAQSTFSENPEAGVLLNGGDRNRISANRFVRNGDQLVVSGNANVVSDNLLADALGCDEGCGFGISLEGGHDNVVERNVVAGAIEAGIRVASFESEGGPPTVANTVRLNAVSHSKLDGVLVGSMATNTLLDRNVATGSGDDGFDVDSPATTLVGNLAVGSGDFGIEAVPGVTDGGGNRARPRRCTNVSCG
jgi:parallel beta-helix repeat protein